MQVYFDGGSRGNPGPAALGFVVFDESMKEVHREGRYLGETTNNCAEYQALIASLAYCRDHCEGLKVKLFCDSELVVNQMLGRYRVRSPLLKPLYARAVRLFGELDASLLHVRRKKNQIADAIVNQVLDLASAEKHI